MKKQLSILAIFAAILLVALAASPVGANNGKGEIIGVTGIVPGQDLIVHILALVPPGADRNEVAKQVLASQGARSMTKQEFSEIDLTWDQFFDGTNNPSVTQYYNSADQPAGVTATQLTNTQVTWSQGTWTTPLAATSSFRFTDGGPTSRCPSLVKECRGRQSFDGNNDVAWLALKDPNTLGVTWTGTSIDEADMALNTNFNWDVNGGDFDVETVLLHENGHALGLGHSADITALMYPSYQGVARSLTADEIDGVSSKYPVPGPVVLSVTTSSLPGGEVDAAYSATLTAANGTTPYTWLVILGSLPDGLSLDGSTGEISGSPTAVETQGFTVQVTDGASDTAFAVLSIDVADAPVPGTTVGVSAISYSTSGGKNGDKNLRVTISVADDQGAAVASASVSIRLSNSTTEQSWTGTASTGTNGSVTFQLRNAPDGLYSTIITGIAAADLDWDLDDGLSIDPGFDKSSGNLGRGNSSELVSE